MSQKFNFIIGMVCKVSLSFLLIVFSWSVKSMASTADMPLSGGFSFSWQGGLQTGSKKTSFDGEKTFHYETADTLNSDTETGIGVFELGLQKSDLMEINAVVDILCSDDMREGGFQRSEPRADFSVVCVRDGKAVKKHGSQDGISENKKLKIYKILNKFEDQARGEGRKLVKLDFVTDKVERNGDDFIVSIRFINSGSYWIKFKTPDQWSGTAGGERLGAGSVTLIQKNGSRETIAGGWSFALGGQTLLNRIEFPDGVVALQPGESKIFKFETSPNYKAPKGEYEFSGIAIMSIQCEYPSSALSGRLFFNPIKTRITLDHDYPSTPQEREQWEATHRAGMSSYPVKPGEQFAEDGLHRAVRLADNGAYRSLQLVPFKAGDVATQDNVKMLMASAGGTELNGLVQWL